MKNRTLIEYLFVNQEKYGLKYTNHLINAASHRVRGFKRIGTAIFPASQPIAGSKLILMTIPSK